MVSLLIAVVVKVRLRGRPVDEAQGRGGEVFLVDRASRRSGEYTRPASPARKQAVLDVPPGTVRRDDERNTRDAYVPRTELGQDGYTFF